MNRILATLIATSLWLLALPLQAAEYAGYARNWWVMENGDAKFYVLTNPDVSTTTGSQWLNGYCGSGVYLLKVTNANYDETFASLLLAAKNNYPVIWDITTCEGNINVVNKAKVCTWAAACI